jgi:Asp-tRNA(Asn)/Glu-tRNA(Gln) amidotransferase A subunit family amidase
VDLAADVREGRRSPVAIVECVLDRIDRRNDSLNAYVTCLEDRAVERARAIERTIRDGGDPGPLAGVPVAIKDLTPIEGVRQTFGSVPFADHVAEETDPVVERLLAAGAIVVGTTNTSEFGHKAITENALVGTTPTPFDRSKTAGGSSGGSAAAVADGLASIAQGTDAGGSVRIPASFCGIYGFKPTFGRIPYRSRPDAFEHTYLCHGPLTRTVEDAAVMLDVLAGPHAADPFSLPEPTTVYRECLDRSVDHLDVGYCSDLDVYPVDPAVRSVLEEVRPVFESACVSVRDASLEIEYTLAEIVESLPTEVGAAVQYQRLKADHGVDLFEHRETVDPDLLDRIERGLDDVPGTIEYRADENRVRTGIYESLQRVFDSFDLLVLPTACLPPFDAAIPPFDRSTQPTEIDGQPVHPLSGWSPCHLFNMTTHPAASVPAGFSDGGLPIGVQIVGQRFADGDVLAASAAFERRQPWDETYPP